MNIYGLLCQHLHIHIQSWKLQQALRSELQVIALDGLRRIKATGTPLSNEFSYLFRYLFISFLIYQEIRMK